MLDELKAKYEAKIRAQNEDFTPEEWREHLEELRGEVAAIEMAESIVEDLEQEQDEEFVAEAAE